MKTVKVIGIVCAIVGTLMITDFVMNKDAYSKEWCLQSGGTAVEEPAGTFQKCIN